MQDNISKDEYNYYVKIQLGSFYIQTLQAHNVSQTNFLGKLDREKHYEIDNVDINMLIS